MPRPGRPGTPLPPVLCPETFDSSRRAARPAYIGAVPRLRAGVLPYVPARGRRVEESTGQSAWL